MYDFLDDLHKVKSETKLQLGFEHVRATRLEYRISTDGYMHYGLAIACSSENLEGGKRMIIKQDCSLCLYFDRKA